MNFASRDLPSMTQPAKIAPLIPNMLDMTQTQDQLPSLDIASKTTQQVDISESLEHMESRANFDEKMGYAQADRSVRKSEGGITSQLDKMTWPHFLPDQSACEVSCTLRLTLHCRYPESPVKFSSHMVGVLILIITSVATFFQTVPSVHNILCREVFLSRLSLPPNHPQFPHVSLLHAICALSARSSAIVKTDTIANIIARKRTGPSGDVPIYDYGPEEVEDSPCFAERQARYAILSMRYERAQGRQMIEMLQAQVSFRSLAPCL